MTETPIDLLVDLAELAACLVDVRPKEEPTTPRPPVREKQEWAQEKEAHGE